MKIKKINIFCLLFTSIILRNVNAQDSTYTNKNAIGLISKYNGKNVVLRWAPSSSSAFYLLKKYGYKIEKAQIATDTNYYKAVWKTLGIFKQADSMTWAKRVDTNNNYQVIAAHCALANIKAPLPNNPNFSELMKRNNEEQNIYGFALSSADFDTTAANLLGLRFEDYNVKSNAVYVYKITSLVPDNQLKISGGETYVQTLLQNSITPPTLLEYGYENHVVINFYNQLHKTYFSGYYLERGDANGNNFKRLNHTPMVKLIDPGNKKETDMFTYIDSVPKDYVKYSYRLIGINAFGELSEPSPVVYSYGRDRTPPSEAYDVIASDVLGQFLEIKWKKDVFENDFIGFNVLRSNNHQGPFEIINEKLLKKETTSFLDKFPDIMQGSFYKVEALDTANNQSWSLGVYGFLKDTVAPSTPKGLTGSMDTNGIVTLSWRLGPELDIKGYRVYFANQIDHEFTILTGDLHQDTTFTDTFSIKTLTEDIFFQISASDRHYNHSPRSEILKIKRPDTIAPMKPMFKNILVTDTAVYLSWILSSSLDVVKHKIYRKIGDGQFTLWQNIDGKLINNIVDKEVKIGEIYTYKIEAIDDANNSSGFPAEVSGKIYDVGKRSPIENFKAEYNKEKKRTILSWTYPASDKYHFVVYRSYNGSSFRVYHSVDGKKNTYEDWDLLGKGTYTYAVVAYYMDGGSSGMTEKVDVVVK